MDNNFDSQQNNQQPNYQQPNYQQPNYQQPNYQQPNYQQPNYQQPNYQQPNYQQPNYQQPNYQQPMYNAPHGGYRAPIQKRDIAMCIILSIVTCGIYGIYWMISLVNDLNAASDSVNDTSGGMVFLLSLVTFNIYTLYWMYKAGEKVSYIRAKNGRPDGSQNGLLYLILALFGLGLVSYCLIQNELNEVASN